LPDAGEPHHGQQAAEQSDANSLPPPCIADDEREFAGAAVFALAQPGDGDDFLG